MKSPERGTSKGLQWKAGLTLIVAYVFAFHKSDIFNIN
jgi:hypothetical protein